MNSIARRIGAMVLLAGAGFYPHVSLADGFTGKDFIGWSEESQNSYIQTSVMMAGVIGSQVKPSISRCIDDWYFADADTKASRDRSIRESIGQYESYHPSGVILAILQDACGTFE